MSSLLPGSGLRLHLVRISSIQVSLGAAITTTRLASAGNQPTSVVITTTRLANAGNRPASIATTSVLRRSISDYLVWICLRAKWITRSLARLCQRLVDTTGTQVFRVFIMCVKWIAALSTMCQHLWPEAEAQAPIVRPGRLVANALATRLASRDTGEGVPRASCDIM